MPSYACGGRSLETRGRRWLAVLCLVSGGGRQYHHRTVINTCGDIGGSPPCTCFYDTRFFPYLLSLQDGSDYYIVASNLKKIFEEKYAKMVKDDGASTL